MEEFNNTIEKLDSYLFRIGLQFFADNDEKTEEATEKKKRDVRKKGQVAQSQELTSAVVLLVAFILLKTVGSSLYQKMSELTVRIFEVYIYDENIFTIGGIIKFFAEMALWFLQAMLPIFATIMVVGVLINIVQTGFLFTAEGLKPKASNINPLRGVKNLFSLKSIAEFFIKSVVKVLIVGIVAYNTIMDNTRDMINIMNVSIISAGEYIMTLMIDLGMKMSICLVIFAIVDYIYQRRKYRKDIRMTKQEVKEEYKQTEGNPQIKSKIKQKQRQMSLSRMMQNVPKADVVIANPTHFAVAIEYKPDKNDVPIVVAKGQDYVALRIKEIAKQNKVEIVENKPLARALYAKVEIGQPIPEELYQAVAEVLAYVYSLKAV